MEIIRVSVGENGNEKCLRIMLHGIKIVIERSSGEDFTAEIDSREENHINYVANIPLISKYLKRSF